LKLFLYLHLPAIMTLTPKETRKSERFGLAVICQPKSRLFLFSLALVAPDKLSAGKEKRLS
jgi:hypothetical protein